MEIRVSNINETRSIAIDLANKVLSSNNRSGAVLILLKGDLGAGKTTFTQYFSEALGVKNKVKSPTFTLMKEYSFDWNNEIGKLYHLDCYRISGMNQIQLLDLESILKDSNNVVVIEWPEKIFDTNPDNSIEIIFKHGDKEGERLIQING